MDRRYWSNVSHEIEYKGIKIDTANGSTSMVTHIGNYKGKVQCAAGTKNLGIIFKYTAPGTPQQVGVVERAFATMLGKTRAIMNGAGFDEKKRHFF